MSTFAFCLKQFNVHLGQRAVVKHVDAAVHAGEWISLVGPNGAGKSTLLRAMAGLIPYQGEVELFGQSLIQMSHAQRARKLAWLGQNEAGGDDLLVSDVVMLGRLPHQSWFATPSPDDAKAVQHALETVDAWALRKHRLGELSGGERQRVLLARALAVQAEVLLMDEPLNNLDPPHQADWLNLVRNLVAQGQTVISVLHELSMALLADQVMVMQAGHLVHYGSSDDPKTHAAMRDVFQNRVRIVALEGRWVVLPD